MKHILLISIIILLTAALAACGSDNNESTGEQQASASSSGEPVVSSVDGVPDVLPSTTVTQPLTLQSDLGIIVDGMWFPIYQDASKLLQVLGDDYEYYSAPSCAFIGEDKEFSYSCATVYTNPDGETDIWYLIVLTDDTLQTSRGIKVGDSLEDVVAVYGEQYYWDGESVLAYSLSGDPDNSEDPCMLFTVSNNTVMLIEIYYPTGEF